MRFFYLVVTVGLADFVTINVSQEDFENLVKQVNLLEATVESHEYHIRELKIGFPRAKNKIFKFCYA